MIIQELHNRIRNQLAYLSTTLQGASAMRQTDIHRLSETIICPVLRIALQLPALRDLNATERSNFPGIDLGDALAGVGIQVTIRADAVKIRNTIAKCIRHSVYQAYPHLRIYVLTAKQSRYRLDLTEDLDGKLTFDPLVDVLDFTDILSAATSLDVADLSAIDEALATNLGSFWTAQSDTPSLSADEPGWLNLLPVTFPPQLYIAETIREARPKPGSRMQNPRRCAKRFLNHRGLRFSSDWTVYDRQVVIFHDLGRRDLPLAEVVDAGTVTEMATEEYHRIDSNYRRAFKSLLRLCLQQLLYRRRVFWQHEARFFCFGPLEDDSERRVESWTDRRRATREVFKRVPKQDAPDDIYYCRHLAFRAAFHVFASVWYMSIKPEWHFSVDGYRQWFWGADRIDYLKRIEKNQTVFNHVKFIAHFLRRPPDLFSSNPVNPFLTFGPLASLRGLPQLNDRAWQSDEAERTRARLEDPDGPLLLPLEGV